MPTPFEPNIGQWYQDLEGRSFEVVALDELDVEVQFYDGEVEEFDMDTWYLLDLHPTEAPKDWNGPFEDVNVEDVGDIDSYIYETDTSSTFEDF